MIQGVLGFQVWFVGKAAEVLQDMVFRLAAGSRRYCEASSDFILPGLLRLEGFHLA